MNIEKNSSDILISAAGSIAAKSLVIYYPKGESGWINIMQNGECVSAFAIDNSGAYRSDESALAAGDYEMYWIVKRGDELIINGMCELCVVA